MSEILCDGVHHIFDAISKTYDSGYALAGEIAQVFTEKIGTKIAWFGNWHR